MTQRFTLFFLLASLILPGCIVQDIHDQIENSNNRLTAINRTVEQIERTNTLLTSIEKSLSSIDTRLESIDQNLGSVDTRLSALQIILDAVSEHLASLRKTINNIDSTIPFLNLSGDDATEQEALEGGEADPAVPQNVPPTEPADPEPQLPPASPQPPAGSGS